MGANVQHLFLWLMKKIVYLFLAALGFGTVGCENNDVMYAPLLPNPTKLKAHVVDEDGNAIKGIEVSAGYNGSVKPAGYTDENGDCIVSWEDDIQLMKFKDVDGEENGGEFEEKHLNMSRAEKHRDGDTLVVDVKLEKK